MDIEGFFSLKFWVFGSWLMILVGLLRFLPDRPLFLNQAAFATLFLGTALLNFLIPFSPGLQRLIISPRREHLYRPGPFFFIGFMFLMFGLSLSVNTLLLHQGICPFLRGPQKGC
jgi:hypothetical protein